MKTQFQIVKDFDKAVRRLADHSVRCVIQGTFILSSTVTGNEICRTDTVEGLTSFANALDFARSS